MQAIFDINNDKKTPKYLQLVHFISDSIKLGKYIKGDRIFSINELSDEFCLSRDTVQRAYAQLKEEGIILPIKGKGYFISRTDINRKYRVLLVFNKLSVYKKMIYDTFTDTLGESAAVDLKIYNGEVSEFTSILSSAANEYDYYVVIPRFNGNPDEAYSAIQQIPCDRLLVLDKDLPCSRMNYSAVYQDFQNDITDALESGLAALMKYDRLNLVFPGARQFPYEIVSGFKNFCIQHNFRYNVFEEIRPEFVRAQEAYLVIDENDLVNLIKVCKTKKFRIGKTVGIISYNDSPMKEVLLDGITVVSTDHRRIGAEAAQMILNNTRQKIRAPFSMTMRKSL